MHGHRGALECRGGGGLAIAGGTAIREIVPQVESGPVCLHLRVQQSPAVLGRHAYGLLGSEGLPVELDRRGRIVDHQVWNDALGMLAHVSLLLS